MGRKADILIVDDEEVVRQSYMRTLSSDSYRVQAAWDAEEALKIMEKSKFDVVLVDLRMPGMNGIDLLRTIKERWPECEVVVITGYGTLESAKEAVRLGAYNYLTKPVGPDEVVKATSGAIMQKKWTLQKENSESGEGESCSYRFPWEN